MIVHYVVGLLSIKNDIETVREVTDIIHKQGHILSIHWSEAMYYDILHNVEVDPKEEMRACELTLEAIERSDVAIIDATQRGFGLGFETAYVLSKNIPTLILLKKDKSVPSRFSTYYKHPLITRKEYDENTVEKIITQFLKQNTIKTKDLRFNFVADRQIHNYLNWKSKNSNRAKSEILRELIEKDIQKNNG